MISLLPEGRLGPAFAAAGVPVLWLDLMHHPLRDFVRLCSAIRRERADIVQTWMYHADVMGGIAARLCGVRRVIWGIRQTSIGLLPAPRALRVMYRLGAWLSHTVPHAIVCNAHAARLSHVAYGYSDKRMHVIANGFDAEVFNPATIDRATARGLHGFADEHIVVGHLARYSPEKDHATFIHAARLALDQHPGLRFVMAGPGVDAGNQRLGELLRQHGLTHHMRLLGEQRDTLSCFKAMDVFCLSSQHEGFPNVLGEAMSMGLPCVTTRAGDAAELAGSAATVVPCADAPALAAALVQEAQRSSQERQARGQASRQRIQTHFGINSMRQRFEQLYVALSSLPAPAGVPSQPQ